MVVIKFIHILNWQTCPRRNIFVLCEQVFFKSRVGGVIKKYFFLGPTKPKNEINEINSFISFPCFPNFLFYKHRPLSSFSKCFFLLLMLHRRVLKLSLAHGAGLPSLGSPICKMGQLVLNPGWALKSPRMLHP